MYSAPPDTHATPYPPSEDAPIARSCWSPAVVLFTSETGCAIKVGLGAALRAASGDARDATAATAASPPAIEATLSPLPAPPPHADSTRLRNTPAHHWQTAR